MRRVLVSGSWARRVLGVDPLKRRLVLLGLVTLVVRLDPDPSARFSSRVPRVGVGQLRLVEAGQDGVDHLQIELTPTGVPLSA